MTAPAGRFEAVIGLEVHAQLLARSKSFSPDSTAFGAAPNTHVDPVSLGHPGTLPVVNDMLLRHAVSMGLATNCRIAPRSQFARKHYFYPDLPKGYQISQYESPICEAGWVEIEIDEKAPAKRIGITRIHMEEDAGKSIHDLDPRYTLLDYNRAGVPLIEIVSEPDLRSPAEAGAYLRRIRQIVRYLGICDGNMQEGSLRCDANVSIRPVGTSELGTKTEIKNLNSIRHVERALESEIDRHVAVIENGEDVVQETRLWDEGEGITRSMRAKEESHDYRYFPDPDLPPVVIDEALLNELRATLPELPDARRRRFVEDLGLPEYDAGVLTEDRAVADYFEGTLHRLGGTAVTVEQAKAVSNFVMGDVLRTLKEQAITIDQLRVRPDRLAALVSMRQDDQLSSTAATEVYEAMQSESAPPEEIARARNLLQVSDAAALEPVVDGVIREHPNQVSAYRNGKSGLLGFFVGQVMRSFPGAADPKLVREMLVERLGGEGG